jgi:hypothetical protein
VQKQNEEAWPNMDNTAEKSANQQDADLAAASSEERYDQSSNLPPLAAFRRSEYARTPPKSATVIKITLIIAAALASLALLFIVLYLRYKRCVARRTKEREEYLIRAGRLQLRQRWLNLDGTLRQDEFYPEKYCNMQERLIDKEEEEEDDDDNDDNMMNLDLGFGDTVEKETKAKPKKKKSIAQQLLKTVTSGKLLHVINNTMVKGQKKLSARFAQPAMTTEERDQYEAQSRLMDESVNPLYPIRVRQAEMDRQEAEEQEALIAKQFAEKIHANDIATSTHLRALDKDATYASAALDAFDAFDDNQDAGDACDAREVRERITSPPHSEINGAADE